MTGLCAWESEPKLVLSGEKPQEHIATHHSRQLLFTARGISSLGILQRPRTIADSEPKVGWNHVLQRCKFLKAHSILA